MSYQELEKKGSSAIPLNAWSRMLCYIFVGLGLFLRAKQLIEARSLMIDEAGLASNFAVRSFLDLLRPLDFQQFAPLLFLWMEKTSVFLFGHTELALRLFPFILGSLSLLLFSRLADRWWGSFAALWPIAAFSMSPLLIRFTTEVKQYGGDVFVGLLLIWLMERYLRDRSKSRLLVLYLGGAASIFFSMPSIFLLVSIMSYFLWEIITGKIQLKTCWWLCLGWSALFIVNYILFLSPSVQNDYLQNYHQAFYIGSSAANQWELLQLPFFHANGHTALAIIGGIALWLAGLRNLLKREKWLFVLCFFPLLFVYTASALHLYSILPRLMLFSLPLIFIAQGSAIGELAKWKPGISLWFILLWTAATLPIYESWNWFYDKFEEDHAREALDYLAENLPDERVYTENLAAITARYYQHLHRDKNKWQELDLYYGRWEEMEYGDVVKRIDRGEFSMLLATHYNEQLYQRLNERICIQLNCKIVKQWHQNTYLIRVSGKNSNRH